MRTSIPEADPVAVDGDPAAAPTTTAVAVGERPTDSASSGRRARVVTACIAAATAIAVVLGNRWLFPLYSLNRDDSVYVAMARTIERGHLTVPSSHWPFRPWATGLVDGHYVYKYAPPWPAALAFADAVGSLRLALAATAAGAVLAVRALALEVARDAVTATVAAALLALSPILLLQGSTYLPYLSALLVLCAATALLLRGGREGSGRRLVAAGALAGLALFARPFDAVLLLVPAIALALRSAPTARRLRAGAWIAAGLAPVLAIDVLYNWTVVGGPLSLPFGVTGSADAFGFGRRGVFESSTLPFDFLDGLSGAGQNLRWIPSWTFGGPVLLAIAVWGAVDLVRNHRQPGQLVLISWAVLVPLGYLFFWGPWAMAFNWDGVETFGPFYHLPVFVPIVVFGAHGLRLLASRPRVAVVALAVMVGFTAWSVPDKIDANRSGTEQFRAAQRAVDRADLHDAVLFLPWRGESGFLGLTPFLEYDPDLDGDVLYAQDCGTATNDETLRSFPGRDGYRLEVVGDDLEDVASYAIHPIRTDSPTRRIDCER
jgi:hypothetical protein